LGRGEPVEDVIADDDGLVEDEGDVPCEPGELDFGAMEEPGEPVVEVKLWNCEGPTEEAEERERDDVVDKDVEDEAKLPCELGAPDLGADISADVA
jgi:hypothetical protein